MGFERGLLKREVGCKVLVKLRRVKVGETVCGLLHRVRLGEITGEPLSVLGLTLSGVRHVGRHVD
jgi:hypothetical protein